ncbi:MAG: non-canonical purine NTP pyrophosphatase [Cytophagales bacterium]|nr:non-canonical purine NTP pyrophosphatase [Cytophagales bacterium]
MKLVLASNNQGKLFEMQALFAPLAAQGVTIISQSELHVPEAPEPFKTFLENALAKARNAAMHTGLPALADDAGLCVDALHGLPGVDTAYYATQFGLAKGDNNNVTALLDQMKRIDNRRAALVSTLVAVRTVDDPEPLVAVGRAVGEITKERIGAGGFGFDPVLFIPAIGKTFAQLSPEEKNARSHRGQAARLMVELIKNNWL